LENPTGIDELRPHFQWKQTGTRRGTSQSAYHIQVTSAEAGFDRPAFWDTEYVESRDSFDVKYAGRQLPRTQRCLWRVRIWDENGAPSPWSAVASFETGIHEAKWAASWIGVHRKTPADAPPAVYLRKQFEVPDTVESARLYITARGLFTARINGQNVGRDVLVPGWTDYRFRIDYLVYDVTFLLQPGPNVIEVVLGDGWWSGILSEPQFGLRYGVDPALLAQLVIHRDDGTEAMVASDETWLARLDGPISANSLYHGETYDARRELALTGSTNKPHRGWKPAEVFPLPELELKAKHCPPVRRMQEQTPIAVTEPQPGVYIFDMGENIAGWARLRVTAPEGTEIRLRFGEMLEADGTLYIANLRSARATDRYTCRSGSEETWEPSFTYHGFRYVEVTGLPSVPDQQTITGIVLYSTLADVGTFECSDPLINRLQQCIVRGQKGNFIDLPSDCPQRDERLGWSGDAQVFAPTACYNMESAPLFRSWMRAMRDGQRADGAFPDLAPHVILEHGNAGWGDAGIIVPWTVWRFTGDTGILEENYEAMARHVEFQHRSSRKLIRPDTLFGDWLSPDAARPENSPTPKDLIGTAYFVHTTRLLGEIAAALGKKRDAQRYGKLAGQIRAAFQREFVTPGGRVLGDTQTSYLLALGFDLLDASFRPAAIERLVELIRARDWHLATGFLGTPLLCPVLSACGHPDVAYRLLKQETYPSWLYPVLNGATTMWERWNSWTKERGFGDVGMNSFNHYAYGAVGEWLYSTVAGIAPQEPGFKRIRIAPIPGGRLTNASAELDTPLGKACSAWKLHGKFFQLDVTIPPNAEAEVHLPHASRQAVTESGKPLKTGNGLISISTQTGNLVLVVASGAYRFHCPAPSFPS